jgi:cytochrome c
VKTHPSLAALAAALVLCHGGANAQNATAGKAVFGQCAACHSIDGKNGLGPSLKGIVGRTAGSAPGFHYSHAMANVGKPWDAASLAAFIESPQKAVPGNVMPFSGLPDAGQRADLLAYLQTLK